MTEHEKRIINIALMEYAQKCEELKKVPYFSHFWEQNKLTAQRLAKEILN